MKTALYETDLTDAQWAYQRGPDGTALLQFTGQVTLPPGSSGTKIPLEYRGGASAETPSTARKR